jgi:NADH-quinone oxidoreductase subunit G
LADATGAKLAWIPRRAGERGAIEAGALPGLLPVGRPVTDPAARAEVARAWNKSALPSAPGRDTNAILAAVEGGELGGLVVAGVDPADLPDPAAALRALEAVPFLVSLELRASAVTDRADVVFPVAAVAEKPGTFVNWEGRGGTFAAALKLPGVRTDLYVLGAIADEMDVHLGLPDPAAARADLTALGAWKGERASPPAPLSPSADTTQLGGAVAARLSTWQQMIDAGRLQEGEPYLAATARPVVAKLSAATAAAAGVADGDKVTVATAIGSVTVPAEITAIADGVVWLPTNSPGSAVRASLGAGHGSRVTLRRAE